MAGRCSNLSGCLSANRLEVEDLGQDGFQDRRVSVVGEATIAMAAVVAVFVAAPETFAKVVVVVVAIYVETIVAVIGIAIRVTVFVVVTPTVVTVGPNGATSMKPKKSAPPARKPSS